MVESKGRLGGLSDNLSCKSTSRCERCDVCQPRDLARELLQHPTARVSLSSSINGARKTPGGWEVEIAGPGGTTVEEFGSVIIAVGPRVYDPTEDPRLRYGEIPDVLTSLEADRMVRSGRLAVPSTGERPRSLAIVQCIGSRDRRHGAPYCSKACCKYAYKLARHLKHADPELGITFFHLDWRPLDDPLSALHRWEGEGGRVIRARPSEIEDQDGRPAVRYATPDDEAAEESFDMVILTVGMLPPSGERLARMFGVDLDEHGFFPAERDNVLAVGYCAGPKDILESIREGIAAAGRAASMLGGRS